jgi:hypothetical protein
MRPGVSRSKAPRSATVTEAEVPVEAPTGASEKTVTRTASSSGCVWIIKLFRGEIKFFPDEIKFFRRCDCVIKLRTTFCAFYTARVQHFPAGRYARTAKLL